MSDEIKIKESTFYLSGIILLILLTSIFFIGGGSGKEESVGSADLQDGVQKVILGFKNYNYYPNTIKVKAGIPVSISLDDSVYGCFRDFTIRDFGIREYLERPSDSVEFTPDKPGRYTFACSMGMGTGTIIVE